MTQPARFRAVIFDLFGTLIDSFPTKDYERMLEEMARALDLPVAAYRRLWEETMPARMTGGFATTRDNVVHICQALGSNPSAKAIDRATEVRMELSRRTMVPRADAALTLSSLRAAGCRLALISDCTPEIPILWPETDIAPLFDTVIFSCTACLKKPDPRIYQMACTRLGIPAQDCLYVGDGASRELTGAEAVGVRALRIRVPREDTYEAHRLNVDDWQGRTITALTQVLEEVLATAERD